MPGRYAVTCLPDRARMLLEEAGSSCTPLRACLGAAPGMQLPVLALPWQSSQPVLADMRWGYLPRWAKPDMQPRINAWVERVSGSALFRSSWARRRCLVPADGYFQWVSAVQGKKTPYYITSDEPVMLAGLWDRGPDGEDGFCLLTQPACGEVAVLNGRVPIVVPAPHYRQWLAAVPLQPSHQQAVLACSMATPWRHWQVSTKVARPGQDDPALLEPL